MLKTIREKLNAFLLFLENVNIPNGWKNTYEVVVSFILIVWMLAGLFAIASFLSITNLLIIIFIVGVLGVYVWFTQTFGK